MPSRRFSSAGSLHHEERRGGGEVFWPVGVEEWIYRLVGEGNDREPVTRRPDIDLAYRFIHYRAAQIFAQSHRPEADHRMRLTAGRSASQLRAGFLHIAQEPGNEISRQERRVGRDADDMGAVRAMVGRPV